MREALRRAANKLTSYAVMMRRLGVRAGGVLILVDATMFVAKRTSWRRRHRIGSVRLRGYPHRLWFRWFSSDAYVIRQIFSEREYETIDLASDPEVIVDCGANIGCSTVWFLSRYPSAKVICVEPHPGNVDLCMRNVAPWGDAVDVIQGAVWPTSEQLEIIDQHDLEWAFRVRPDEGAHAEREERCIAAVTMEELVRRSPNGRIDLLKMDIEGAERDVFENSETWLDAVGAIAIELHSGSEETFFRALSPYAYDQSAAGELTICTSIRRRSRDAAQTD